MGASGSHTVADLMTRTVARISPDADLFEVAEKLAAVEVGALVVGDLHAVAGVISERDVVKAVGLRHHPEELHAGDIDSDQVVWCRADATPADAAGLMVERGVRHLLVGDGGVPQGILSVRDVLAALV